MKRKQHLFDYLFFLGIVILASCNSKVDYFPSTSGKTDPSSIEKDNFRAYFPLESTSYSIIKSNGIDSSAVTFGTKNSFQLGQHGYCFQGDTTKSYIQYKLLTNNVFQKLTEFTISSWIKIPVATTDSRTAQLIMIDGGDNTLGSLSISLDAEFLKGYLYCDSVDIKSHEIKVDRSLIKSNEWVHVAFTYNNSTSTMALYANGTQLKVDTCYATADLSVKLRSLKLSKLNMTKLTIGAWPQLVSGTSSSSMKYFAGSLDEIRFWNKGFSKEAINSLYLSELALGRN